MINKKRLLKLLQRLIRIDSQNPPGNESNIARFVKGYLKDLGVSSRIYEFKKKRSNLLALIKGRDRRHSFLITPHLDTVPCGKNWHFDPFKARLYKGRIYGLGATDCKGNLACSLEAINSLIEEQAILEYDLIFAATADEESGSGLGLVPLLTKGILDPDLAVVLDADDLEIIITQKGLLHLKVKIQGRRAHGAYPWRGLNAIDISMDIIKGIKAYRFPTPKNKYLRPPTINIGTISGGDKVNVVADWCEFELDYRFLPGMSADDFLKALKSVIRKHTNKFEIEIEGVQLPYAIQERHHLVTSLKQAIQDIKMPVRVKGSEGATVMTFFQDRNIPALAWGFGREGCAHTADEFARTDDLYNGARALEVFLKNYRFAD